MDKVEALRSAVARQREPGTFVMSELNSLRDSSHVERDDQERETESTSDGKRPRIPEYWNPERDNDTEERRRATGQEMAEAEKRHRRGLAAGRQEAFSIPSEPCAAVAPFPEGPRALGAHAKQAQGTQQTEQIHFSTPPLSG
ncbi:unnamed protein product [Boreogadus saida]